MKQSRLDALADGIFAIIITVLTFELKVPQIVGLVDEQALWDELSKLGPVFLSFILSFALLFTYWRAHHYIASVYAKNINNRLTSINALFFFFIALVPFSSRLLGEYSETRLAVIIYSINIICIGLSLLWMRNYVLTSGYIDHEKVQKSELRRGLIRTIVPVVCAFIAIGLSFYSTQISFFLLTLAIVFNLISRSTSPISWIMDSTLPHNS
jgi:uncharacterized membrane protein